MRPPIRLLAAATAGALTLGLVACGEDDDDAAATPTSPAATEDTTTPSRIISLSSTATEMLFAIGAGDQVVAVDQQSDYPAEAPVSDLDAFQPNVEAIAAHDPDLVVLYFDPGDIASGLEALGIEVLVQDAARTLDDTYAQLEELGEITGHEDEAAAEIERIRTELAALAARVPERDEPLTYYHELDVDLFTVTSETFLGEIYALAGLENVADAADEDGSAGGYPQLSAEYLFEADPDFIFLGDTVCCGQNAETVAARPGWRTLRAVAEGRVVELDDDIASRWGPRVTELLAAIVDAVAAVEPDAKAA